VVNKESRQIKKASKPSHHKYNMKSFYPEHFGYI